MRLASSLAVLLVAASAVGLSCTGLNAADQLGDPAGTGASTFAPGTVGSQCSPNADGCQWQANECEADPVCAQWYKCVLSKPLDANLQNTVASCQSTPLGAAQKKLLNCLYASPSCAAALPWKSGARGAGGGNDETAPGADAATTGPGYNDGNDGGASYAGNCENEPPGPVATSDCANCIIEQVCDTQKDPSNKCYAIKHTYACWVGLEHQWQMENCLYNSQQPGSPYEFSSEAHDALVGLGEMAAWLTKCSIQCSPPDGRCCMACQQAKCKEQLDAFLGSAEAQDYQWCRTHCDYGGGDLDAGVSAPVADAPACRAECEANYPAGYAIVGALVGCKFDQCAMCNNLP